MTTARHHYAVLSIPAAFIIILVLFRSGFAVIKVKEESMIPTLADGQWVLLLRGSQRVSSGDITVFQSPDDGLLAVKRCVLVEGEAVIVSKGRLKTPWGSWVLDEVQKARLADWVSVPPGQVFLVGDNQYHSTDSRDYGFVDRRSLLGRVVTYKKRMR